MWILPTKGRPENLRRFVSANREMGCSTPGLIVVNRPDWVEHEAAYREIEALLSPGWGFVQVDATCYGDAVRAMWDTVKNDDWIGLVCDDLLPTTSKWDTQLLQHLTGWNVVSTNDGWQAPRRLHGAIAWSGDLARAVGWIFPEGLRHIFHDDVWETLGKETSCWQTRMEIMVKHMHESKDGIVGPTMDPTSELWKHDEAWYQNWYVTERRAVVDRIEALKKAKGITQFKVDVKGMSVMVATPSHSGTYDGSYMESLYATTQALGQLGAEVIWLKEQYTADIALARGKLISTFARSSSTHMLMIDADMGWSVDAVLRLFHANKDMVAVAGPKKRYPLQFAANYTDAAGNPIMMTLEQKSGTWEVGEVGAAFMMITRNCALKMIADYPELEYQGVTGESEWGLFIPFVENKRYYSEDFAFCKRWTRKGGHVHICADIPLKHTGTHQFEGALLQTLEQNRQIAAPLLAAAE